MRTPERVVLQPTPAGRSCCHRQGWDDTSILRPGDGCLPRWEGSSCAVGLRGEGKQWEGRGQPVGLPVVGELAESVVAAGSLAIVLAVGLGDGAWSVAGVRVPNSCSERFLDLQQRPSW